MTARVTLRTTWLQNRFTAADAVEQASGSETCFYGAGVVGGCEVAALGAKLSGVHGLVGNESELNGVGGLGGVSHGTLLKSKNSSRFGCAASRAVRCAPFPMKRSSTNLMTAVWSIGV